MDRPSGTSRRSRFPAGRLVRVRSAAEIAATLDGDGTLEGLPFMPEMTRFCGGTFTVRASAHKTCTPERGIRGMAAAAHLEGVHCDGSAHGGCQSRCPLFWKDAWLEPVAGAAANGPSGELERKAARTLRLRGRDPAAGTYSCQATELEAATGELPFWSPRQYLDDVRSGNVTLRAVLRGLPVMLYNKLQTLRGGRLRPRIAGTLTETPDVRTGLEPGERVRVRSHGEILDTVDAEGRNRGLGFYPDMVPYCGARSTVRHRVEVRIDEETGKLTPLRSPCLVLDGVVCRGRYHRFCPRALDIYWREAWLQRD